MLLKSRFWSSVLVAGTLAFSNLALADVKEDYELGYDQFLQGDMVTAMATLRKGVAAGHLKSMVLLAEILDISEFDDEAIALYRKAADQGDPDGMFGLGAMIAAGEGVKQKDQAEALRWIRKAAELGQGQAVNFMALSYLKAEMGFTEADRNTPEALRWVKEAAEKNSYLPALDAMAEAYRSGSMLGVSADPALATQYAAQAAKIRQIEPTKGKKKKKAAAS